MESESRSSKVSIEIATCSRLSGTTCNIFLITCDIIVEDKQLAHKVVDALRKILDVLTGLESDVTELPPQALDVGLLHLVSAELHLSDCLPDIVGGSLYR
jgi:hypothetical protein